jgi:hypothetical protein
MAPDADQAQQPHDVVVRAPADSSDSVNWIGF